MSQNISIQSAIRVSFDDQQSPQTIIHNTGNVVSAAAQVQQTAIMSLGITDIVKQSLASMENGSVIVRINNFIPGSDGYRKDDLIETLVTYFNGVSDAIRDMGVITKTGLIDKTQTIDSKIRQIAQTQQKIHRPLSVTRFAGDICALGQSTNGFKRTERCSAIIETVQVQIPVGSEMIKSDIDKLMIEKTERVESRLQLEIKKPDLLGYSMWELRHKRKTIKTTISDIDWLTGFLQGGQKLSSRDALDADFIQQISYDVDGNEYDVHYFAKKVHGIIPANTNSNQLTIF